MVTVIPNLYQLTLKLQRNDIIVLCDGHIDRQTRQLSYYNIDYIPGLKHSLNEARMKYKGSLSMDYMERGYYARDTYTKQKRQRVVWWFLGT